MVVLSTIALPRYPRFTRVRRVALALVFYAKQQAARAAHAEWLQRDGVVQL